MNIGINPLTGGLEFETHEELKEEIYNIKQNIQNMSKKSIVFRDINANFDPQPSRLSQEERLKSIQSFAQEIVSEQELKELLQRKQFPICYDGFEPSGRMHIAQGIMRAINVNKLVDAGCIFKFWVADWFALLNNKMDGDLDKIKTVGLYFIETWKAAGMKMHNVQFLWASDEINKKSSEYWLRVIDVARKFTITRMKKCSQIMGRAESDELKVSQLLYPAMQCTDIFFLEADICSLGLDQRKVNMLAKEYQKFDKSLHNPVIVSHHMLSGLKEGMAKMSKSDPDSAIFMEDSAQEVERKVNQAYCKPKEIYNEKGEFLNPIMDYTKSIIFQAFDEFTIKRNEANGGNKTYTSYQELEKDYLEGNLHPGDLKPSVIQALNKLIQPVREHFQNDPVAKQLLQQIQSWKQKQESQTEETNEKKEE